MASLALPSFGSSGTDALASPLFFNNGGEILITILSDLILCAITHEGRRREKHNASEARRKVRLCLPSAS